MSKWLLVCADTAPSFGLSCTPSNLRTECDRKQVRICSDCEMTAAAGNATDNGAGVIAKHAHGGGGSAGFG